jgi:hypothetical protein
MTEAEPSRQQPQTPGPAARGTGQESDSHRQQDKERVFEDGRDEQNDPRPTRENRSGTPPRRRPHERNWASGICKGGLP